MQSKVDFSRQVMELYQHLYDIVYLRAHPLTDVLVADPAIPRKEKAWHMHDLLIDIIQELDPGPAAPPFSREWRRHRLMVERYKNGQKPESVMRAMSVSRRQYYREHEAAIETVAELLWENYVINPPAPLSKTPTPKENTVTDRLELLRLEAVRATQLEHFVQAGELIRGVVAVLDERLSQRALRVIVEETEHSARIVAEPNLLRQMLLGLVSYLIERAGPGTLRIRICRAEVELCLSVGVEPPQAILATSQAETQERLTAFAEMAALANAHLIPMQTAGPLLALTFACPSIRRGRFSSWTTMRTCWSYSGAS